MLLIFTPAPYVDATSSWAFRSKWRRIMVGAAGVWAELALAAAAAIVWSRTGVGSPVHAVAYNLMFVTSISTILFNGNPLLRYDAYYILCDVMEMPNLAMRAQQYVYYLVKRYGFGVANASHTAHGAWEKLFFLFYWSASSIYRVFLLAGILLTVASLWFFVGVILALGSLAMWLVLPIFKLLRYLAVSPELSRVRFRAVSLALLVLVAVFGPLVTVPVPDRFRIEGVAESDLNVGVHAASPGFLREVLPSNTEATAGETVVAVLENPALESQWKGLLAREKEILARHRLAEATDPSEAQAALELLAAVREEMRRVELLRRELLVRPDRDGLWVAPRLANFRGLYIEHGQRLGELLQPDSVHIRSFPGQDAAVNLITDARSEIELRVKGRPDLHTTGRIREILPAGRKELPTPALGFPAGGETQVDQDDPKGATSAEHVFEIKVDIDGGGGWRLMPGQVVVIRFSTPDKPIIDQAVRAVRQLLQRRFHV
jgi:putative peptide zinc metalloprotease protein